MPEHPVDKRVVIITITALIFVLCILVSYADNTDYPSTETLKQIASAPWACNARHYDDLSEKVRLQKVAEDLRFDAWLADKATSAGCQLGKEELDFLNERKRELEFFVLKSRIATTITPTESQIKEYSASWTTTLPERYEVFYIFVDTTSAQSEEEKEKLHQRALWLKGQLTKENFKEIAMLWSDHPSGAEGGDFGLISLDDFGPTFVSHIRQTPVGTIGGPYQTKSGWNIFYVRSYTPPYIRNFPKEKLISMTAETLAGEVVNKAMQEKKTWEDMKENFKIDKDFRVTAEIVALENFLLSGAYLRTQISRQMPAREELMSIYKENSALFIHPPNRKAREILLTSDDWTMTMTPEAWDKRRAVRDQARELRDRIMKGEDFQSLARKYSKAKSAPEGGDIGWIQEPSNYIYDTALAKLKIGEVSTPLLSLKGYLLLQLVDIQLKKPMTYEEVERKCKDIWTNRQFKKIKEDLHGHYLSSK